jgi:cysteine-rich repeat protein
MQKVTRLSIAATIWLISIWSVFAAPAPLNITAWSTDFVTPIMKQIFFTPAGAQTTEWVRIDATGIWLSDTFPAINTSTAHTLKLENNASSTDYQEFIQDLVGTSDIVQGAINTNHFISNTIINANIANYTIQSTNIINNSLTTNVFDPSIVFPTGGALFWYTVGTPCAGNYALSGTNGSGTPQCALMGTGGPGALPTCTTTGQILTTSGGAWWCSAPLLSSDLEDSYWSGHITGDIWNKNIGKVGVWISNPTETIHVRERFKVDQGAATAADGEVLCYKTNTWMTTATYNALIASDPQACGICPTGWTYNATVQMCETPYCGGGTGTNGTGCVGVFNASTEEIDPQDVVDDAIPQCSCDLSPLQNDCWGNNDITVDYPGLPRQASYNYPSLPWYPTWWWVNYELLLDNVTDCYDIHRNAVDALVATVYHKLWYTNNTTLCGGWECRGVYNEGSRVIALNYAQANYPKCSCDLDIASYDCLQNNDITLDYPTFTRRSASQSFASLPIGPTLWNVNYFLDADIGENCYDQVDDSRADIYHRIWYTNGRETCDNNHVIIDEHGVCGPANGWNRASATDAASAGLCGSGYPVPGVLSDPGPWWWQCVGSLDSQDCSADQNNGVCGDGILQQWEQCDDANAVDTDSCHNNCISDITTDPTLLGCTNDPSIEVRTFTIGDVDNFDPTIKLTAPRLPSTTYDSFINTYLLGMNGMPAWGLGYFDTNNNNQYYLAEGSIPKCYNGKKLTCAGVQLKAKEIGGMIQTDGLSLMTKDPMTTLPSNPAGPYTWPGLSSYFNDGCSLNANLFTQYSNGIGNDFYLNLTACPTAFINSILAGNEHVYVWGNDDHNPDYIQVYAGYTPDADCYNGTGGSVGAGGTPWDPQSNGWFTINEPWYFLETPAPHGTVRWWACVQDDACRSTADCGWSPNSCDKWTCNCRDVVCVQDASCEQDLECWGANNLGTCTNNQCLCN